MTETPDTKQVTSSPQPTETTGDASLFGTTDPSADIVMPAAIAIETLVSEWKAELDGQQSISATNVQDRLLDLWGQLPAGNPRSEIEQWLTETVQRHLYAVADIDARLQRVLASA